jgi:hypothetical protein
MMQSSLNDFAPYSYCMRRASMSFRKPRISLENDPQLALLNSQYDTTPVDDNTNYSTTPSSSIMHRCDPPSVSPPPLRAY